MVENEKTVIDILKEKKNECSILNQDTLHRLNFVNENFIKPALLSAEEGNPVRLMMVLNDFQTTFEEIPRMYENNPDLEKVENLLRLVKYVDLQDVPIPDFEILKDVDSVDLFIQVYTAKKLEYAWIMNMDSELGFTQHLTSLGVGITDEELRQTFLNVLAIEKLLIARSKERVG